MEELNDLNKIIKDDVLIEALYLDDKVPEDVKQLIKPAAIQRDWMSQEDQKYSYHCIPLTHANQLGYWLLNNNDATIHWDGGKNIQDVKITLDNPDAQKLISSHFPIGIITFSFPFLFKTPPGWGLYISSCPNYPINGLQGLEAIVETNWLPFTFTMNFKITEPNKVIKIPKGMPICRIYPFPLNTNEKTKLEIKSIAEYPEIRKNFNDYSNSRRDWNDMLKSNTKEIKGSEARQKFYKNGTNAQGDVISEGFHKMDYKYNMDYNINHYGIDSEMTKKCPFLSSYKEKFSNFFKKNRIKE